jgi:hypothetical protein
MSKKSQLDEVHAWAEAKGLSCSAEVLAEPPAELDCRSWVDADKCPKDSSGLLVKMKVPVETEESWYARTEFPAEMRILSGILKSEGLLELYKGFQDHKITDDLLPGLSDPELQTVGVSKLGDRKRLIQAFQKVQPEEVGKALAPVENLIAISVWIPFDDSIARKFWISELDSRHRFGLNSGDVSEHLDDCIVAFKRDHVYWPPVKEWLKAEGAKYDLLQDPPIGAGWYSARFVISEDREIELSVGGEGWASVHSSTGSVTSHETEEHFENGFALRDWVKTVQKRRHWPLK